MLPTLLARKLRYAILDYNHIFCNTSSKVDNSFNSSFTGSDDFSIETGQVLIGLYEMNDDYHIDPFTGKKTKATNNSIAANNSPINNKEDRHEYLKQRSELHIKKATYHLRQRFTDVAVLLLSGYRYFVKSVQYQATTTKENDTLPLTLPLPLALPLANDDNDDEVSNSKPCNSKSNDTSTSFTTNFIFDRTGFLTSITNDFKEFLTMFTTGQIFQRFIQLKILTFNQHILDYFDKCMLNSINIDNNKLDIFKEQVIKGEMYVTEKKIFYHQNGKYIILN